MVGDTQTSFQSDPLDKAVEKLWFSGIVVVAAAGNTGTGTGEVDMSAAPGNDPFVITVGAIDQAQTSATGDDRRAMVFVRPHRGWLREAGAVGPGALPRDAGTGVVNDRHGAARPRRAPGYMRMAGQQLGAAAPATTRRRKRQSPTSTCSRKRRRGRAGPW